MNKQVSLIRQVFSYAQRFRNNIFVVHIDCSAFDTASQMALIRDLALLQRVGIRVILIPGARQRINEVLDKYNISTQHFYGTRIVTKEAMPFVKMAAFDVVNQFMTMLSVENCNAVISNWVRAHSIGVVAGVNFEQSGQVDRIDTERLLNTLKEHTIPIFPCIGWNTMGKPYNLSSRALAMNIALNLKASKLIFIVKQNGILSNELTLPNDIMTSDTPEDSRIHKDAMLDSAVIMPDAALQETQHKNISESESCIRRFTALQGKELLRLNAHLQTQSSRKAPIGGYYKDAEEMLELCRIAVHVIEKSVDRVHILNGTQDGALLLEIFSRTGIGTMVYTDVYDNIRAMNSSDIPTVHKLMEPLIAQDALLKRTIDDIAAHSNDYVVYEDDEGVVIGCGALHIIDNHNAEIAALAVHSQYEDRGIGSKIVQYLVHIARTKTLRHVFVLTTKTSDWFETIGFKPVRITRLPAERRKRYNVRRGSIILHLKL